VTFRGEGVRVRVKLDLTGAVGGSGVAEKVARGDGSGSALGVGVGGVGSEGASGAVAYVTY